MIPLKEKVATTYVDLFFSLIDGVNHQTGQFAFKSPKSTIRGLSKLCCLELGKNEDGSDISEPEPPKLSLPKKIKQAKKDVDYYKKRLKETCWTLTDFLLFEFRLAETKEELAKLRKKEHWLKHSHQEKTVDVEALKQSHDLVEAAEGYGLQLRKRGQEFWAKCPFHQEKNPSFSINKEKQLYYCFGCQESGDLIDFVMKLENCDFKTALERLR